MSVRYLYLDLDGTQLGQRVLLLHDGEQLADALR
jgi:hypothetical protein